MTLKTAALVAALAQAGSLVMTLLTVATRLPSYADPVLLVSFGVNVVAQAALIAFFAVYYMHDETPAESDENIPVYRLDGDQEPRA